MKQRKIAMFETTLPQNYSKGLFEEKSYDLAPEHTDKISYTAFTGVSQLLAEQKSKERPTAYIMSRMDGKIVAAAICQYFESEDKDTPGNWSLVWTFDETDIPDNALKISISDVNSHPYFRAIAGDKWGMKFKDQACIIILITYFFEQLYKWLDGNAAEDEEVIIVQESVFQARVVVDNGQKVFAIEPLGEIKMMIKDDKAIEK